MIPGIDPQRLDSVQAEPIQSGVAEDAQALKETAELFGDHHRTEALKIEMHRWVIWAVRIAALVFLVILIVRGLHMVLSDSYRWLDEKSLQGIDHMLASGFVGGLISRYAKQATGDPSPRRSSTKSQRTRLPRPA